MSSAKQDNVVGKSKKGRSKKLQGPWRDSRWVNSFGGKGASPLKYKEVSPSFILRQLLLLVEKGKFVDASQLVNKTSMDSLRDMAKDVPIELVIERIPQSLILLESLYSRLFVSDADNFPVEQFQVEVMAFHVVRYLSMLESGTDYKHPKPEDAKKSIMNILRIVLHVNPDLVRTLYKRKKLMDTALQGIGEHSLIEVKGCLVTLHDALRQEIGRNVTAYKSAISTLDHLNLSKPGRLASLKLSGDRRPGQGPNHQDLTKLNENQIKSRLFKNKALLNAIEAHINTQLPALVAGLRDRIEYDKSALLAFGKLKSEIKTFSSHTKVVPLLAQYARSLQSVLDMFKELLDEHCGSDKSSYSTLGYHSDEEEDMLSIQATSEDTVSEAVTQPETEGNPEKEDPSTLEQILNPPAGEAGDRDKPSPPGGHEESPDRRSRWWGHHHRRSHSLDVGRRGSAGGNRQSLLGESAGRPRSRASSLDRGGISRPRRESVEESHEFQTMMTRIREMSGSSPAIGRRQLERRGISQPRSRDSSISPAALRRHFFGGGGSVERTPSISSQTESKDSPDALYATIRPKGQRSPLPPPPDKEAPNAGAGLSEKLEGALRDRDRLAASEKKLRQENERLKDTLRLVTMEMEAMKGTESESADEDVFAPSPDAKDPTASTEQMAEAKGKPPLETSATEPVVPSEAGSSISVPVSTPIPKLIPAPQQFCTPEPTVSPSLTSPGAAVSPEIPLSPPTPVSEPVSEPSEPVLLSPSVQEKALPSKSTKTASFVEKQKAILREQAKLLAQSPAKAEVRLEELPESSVRQHRASIELKLRAANVEPSSSQVRRQMDPVLKQGPPSSAKLAVTEPELTKSEPQASPVKLQTPKLTQQVEDVAEPAKPGPGKPKLSEVEEAKPGIQNPVQVDQERGTPVVQVSSDERREDSEQAKPSEHDTAVQVASSNNEREPSPSSQDQMPSANTSQPDHEPREEPAAKPETATGQTLPMTSKPSSDRQERAKPPPQTHPLPPVKPASAKKAKSAKFSSQLHLRPIPESASPVSQPKASSLKEAPDGSAQRVLSASRSTSGGGKKTGKTHTNRHLPKNLIRHVTGDLLYAYDKLYSEQRAVAWSYLTIPPEDKDTLLFSVIVFGFQSAQTTIHELHMAKSRMLLIPNTDDDESVSSYTMDIPPDNRSQEELLEHLRKMGDNFDLNPMIADVMEQLFEITEHVVILQTSAALKKFVTSCVSLAWRLSIQTAPYVIDFEVRSFDPTLHQRVPGSNRKSARIKEHIWPALLESSRGMCVYRGVVLT